MMRVMSFVGNGGFDDSEYDLRCDGEPHRL